MCSTPCSGKMVLDFTTNWCILLQNISFVFTKTVCHTQVLTDGDLMVFDPSVGSMCIQRTSIDYPISFGFFCKGSMSLMWNGNSSITSKLSSLNTA